MYQNPSGSTLSMERRERMLEIAAEYNVPIVENESYADFRIDGDPLPPAMLGMDDNGMVIYVSSYTKLLGCGLRVGFAVAPQQVQDVLTGGMPSQLATMLVYEYLRTRKAEHVETVRRELLSRRDALVSAVRENFPSECEIVPPHGGMMGWVKMPEGGGYMVGAGRRCGGWREVQPGRHIPRAAGPQQSPAADFQPQYGGGDP